jgi:hypothetical protein
VLRLVCKETGNSITLFEETAPAGTETTFHLYRNCDEVAHVLSGEITFKIGDEVTVGGRAPRSCQAASYTPGKTPAPDLFEEQLGRPVHPFSIEQSRCGRKNALLR